MKRIKICQRVTTSIYLNSQGCQYFFWKVFGMTRYIEDNSFIIKEIQDGKNFYQSQYLNICQALIFRDTADFIPTWLRAVRNYVVSGSSWLRKRLTGISFVFTWALFSIRHPVMSWICKMRKYLSGGLKVSMGSIRGRKATPPLM